MPRQALVKSELTQNSYGLSDMDLITPKGSATLNERDGSQSFWSVPSQLKAATPKVNVRITGAYPLWLQDVLERFNYLLTLPENWDSYGAQKVDIKAVVTMVLTLAQLAREEIPAPSVVPSNDGSLQVEWHTKGIDLEIEVNSTGKVDFYYEDMNGVVEPYEDEYQYIPSYIPEKLKKILDILEDRCKQI